MPRAFVLVLDSVGIGGAPDAALYGDAGADTVGHIAQACARGEGDRPGLRSGPLDLPNLARLGLGEACRLANGRVPPGLEIDAPARTLRLRGEVSRGKDTPSGHWEMAGCPVRFDWGYFPNARSVLPAAAGRGALPRGLFCPAYSATRTHPARTSSPRSAKRICGWAHPSATRRSTASSRSPRMRKPSGLPGSTRCALIARRLVDPLNIGRVIARPFVGAFCLPISRPHREPTRLRRAAARADHLDSAMAAGRDIITVGKIADIFAHRATGRVLKASGNAALFDRTIEGARALADGGFLFANFIDFDSLYGHRRDVPGYAAAL